MDFWSKVTATSTRRHLFLITGCTLSSRLVFAQAVPERRRAGLVNFVEGDVKVADSLGVRALTGGAVVHEGQIIETSVNSETHVIFDDGGYLAVRPSSRIQIDKAKLSGAFDDSLSLRLLIGAVRSITGWIGKFDKHNYQLSTGVATVGIRGTDHELANIASEGPLLAGEIPGIHNWVHEGGTTLKTTTGAIDIDPGHAAWAPHNGDAPRAHQEVPNFLQQRRTRQEARIENHAKRINEHIEMRMEKRGLLKDGEKLHDAQRRHHEQKRHEGFEEERRATHNSAESPRFLHHRKW